MTTVVIALGSNLGDRAGNLQSALDLMAAAGLRLVRASSVWETPPVPAGQPAFLNAVAVAETGLAPEALLGALQAIEKTLGRRPAARWGPRPIDLDILLFGEELRATAELTIPHPNLVERAFVLAPLAEVMPGTLPVLGETALILLVRAGLDGLRRTGVPLNIPPEPPGFSTG